jgi:hypothetical protein
MLPALPGCGNVGVWIARIVSDAGSGDELGECDEWDCEYECECESEREGEYEWVSECE